MLLRLILFISAKKMYCQQKIMEYVIQNQSTVIVNVHYVDLMSIIIVFKTPWMNTTSPINKQQMNNTPNAPEVYNVIDVVYICTNGNVSCVQSAS